MNNEADANRESSFHFTNGRAPGRGGPPTTATAPLDGNGSATKPSFTASDLAPFVDALGRRWGWLLLGTLATAMVAWWAGVSHWKDSYTASAQLLRQGSTHVTDVLGDREFEADTYASLLRAPELLQRVAAQAQPPLPPESLATKLNITSERNSEVILIAISTADKQNAVDLANRYATEAVKFMQGLQTNAAARVSQFISQQLAPLEEEIATLSKRAQPAPARRAVAPTLPPSPLFEKLQGAQLELVELLTRYTDQHPTVKEQQAKIAAIENQLRQVQAAPAKPAPVADEASADLNSQARDTAFMTAQLQAVENARLTLIGQKQAALSLQLDPPGMCRILAPASLKEVLVHKTKAKVGVLTGLGGMLGFLMAGALVFLFEALDPRLKTAVDVRRVTGLPVFASAGNLARLTEAEQRKWAFRAWTSLQRRLSASPNQGFICGITSAENGEGRSTWIRWLADAASQRGFRVLTIVARPPGQNGEVIAETGAVARGMINGEGMAPPDGNLAMVASHALSTPDEVTRKLIGPNGDPVVQIPLPGWVWDLDRRKQWRAALQAWSQIDNIALLVELPPASMPETVLLAENLPNLIWLADGEKATARETREQLETLRQARCNLVGAVLNRARPPFLKNRLARWLG